MSQSSSIMFLSLLVALGCSDENDFPTVRISGQVLLDGVAIDQGTIDFVPIGSQKGRSTTAKISAGAYDADVAPGKQRVYIHATRETGRTVTMFDQAMPERESLIPEHYHQGIDVVVSDGDATHDFDLTQARP